MRALRTAALFASIAAAAVAADRSKPPVAGPPKLLRLPPVQRLALANGLPVFLVESHELPTVEIRLVVRVGSTSDPLDRPGVASFTADMLDEGAGGKDALGLADAIDFLGAALTTGSSWDASTVQLHVPVARLDAAVPLLADVALRPEFPAKELSRLRSEALAELLQERDEPREIAARAMARAVFGEAHRYSRPARGDAASIQALSAEDLRRFHAQHYGPGNAALIVVGDVTRSVLPLLEAHFGAWPAGGIPATATPEPPQVRGRKLWLVDKPGAPQSVIRIGRVGPSRLAPRYHAREVMNTLLGGSFTSRLNDNLREQHGYAYGARSGFSYRRSGGLFQAAADVQTQSTAEAVAEFLKELARIREPASKEEVERARNYLALGYAADFETTWQIASQLAELVVHGLPTDSLEAFVPQVLAVGPAELQRAGRDALDPQNIAVVVVGDRAAIEAPLRALKLGPLSLLTVDQIMGPALAFR